MITIRTDTAPLRKALDRYLVGSRRPREAVMRTQARGILREVLKITPPSNGTTTGTEAKKKGEAAIEADILKVFTPVRKPPADAPDLPSLHKRYRSSSDGRVSKALHPKVQAQKSLLTAYIKAQQLRVGYLLSGWSATARELGVTMAAWMTRNKAPGSVSIRSDASGIIVRSTNAAPFAGNVKDLDRRLQYAVNSQAKKIERQIMFHEEHQHRASGLKG